MTMPIPITEDRAILKLVISEGDPCKLFPKYSAGSKASFHYLIHTIPFKDRVSDPLALFKNGLALVDMARVSSETKPIKEEEEEESDRHNHVYVTDPNKRTKVGDSLRWDGQPFELFLGRGFSVKCFEIAVKTMRIGEKAKFFCMPVYSDAYIQLESILRRQRSTKNNQGNLAGKQSCCAASYDFEKERDLAELFGCPLEVEIHLLDVLDPDKVQKEPWQMSIEELLAFGEKCRVEGTAAFQLKQFQRAADLYIKACGAIQNAALKLDKDNSASSQEKLKVNELLNRCELNLVACEMNMQHYDLAIKYSDEVLQRDKENKKALMYRLKSRLRIGRDLELAESDLALLSALPNMESLGNDLVAERHLLESKKMLAKMKEKQLFQNIFSKKE